jgi:hypothetical protein
VSSAISVWLLVLLALGAANLPFLTKRVLGLLRLSNPKTLGTRLLELIVLYLVVGALGLALENRLGQNAPQTWEFYAITGTLFLTFAFPGFVYRYLLKRKD